MINKLNIAFSLTFFALSMVLFLNPDLDIAITDKFYDQSAGFVYENNIIVRSIYKSIPVLTTIYVSALIIMFFASIFGKLREINKASKYLTILMILAIGPGLIVNLVLKDNFGRARPKQIEEFGGRKTFSRVYEMSDQCYKNCSFASGHAAMGFAFSSASLLVPSRIIAVSYYLLSIGFGLIVGLGRVIQGGHFTSDVFASGGIVLLISFLMMNNISLITKFLKKHIKNFRDIK